MAQGSSSSNLKLIPEAYQALNQFKYEVASELGINPEYKSGYWGNISSRECGAVGGHMVRRMIAAAQQSLVGQTPQTGGFRTGTAGFPLEPDAQK
ncbi:MAG: alpha/beta-type small acid-soluble spore protein [Firmicutes bacterium]|nr:alpha/beta-type small acid-soluble spore protein [Bacillota bacterium]